MPFTRGPNAPRLPSRPLTAEEVAFRDLLIGTPEYAQAIAMKAKGRALAHEAECMIAIGSRVESGLEEWARQEVRRLNLRSA